MADTEPTSSAQIQPVEVLYCGGKMFSLCSCRIMPLLMHSCPSVHFPCGVLRVWLASNEMQGVAARNTPRPLREVLLRGCMIRSC